MATVISRPRARARFLLSFCRKKRRSALPRRLRLRAKNFLLFATFYIIPLSLSPFLPCILASRRGFSRPTPPIFRLRSESGAYSQAPLLPPAFRGGTPILVTWPLVRTVSLVDSTDSAPPAPSAMLLAGHSTPGLFTVSSLPRFGSTPAGRKSGTKVYSVCMCPC